jgi:predicted S18 family serine protease
LAEENVSRTGTTLIFLIVLVLLLFTVLLMLQNSRLRQRLDENTLAIENLTSQVESMGMENSELVSQNQYLEAAVRDYQEKVRSYQTEVFQLRKLANLTGDNTTILARDEPIRMVVPAVMAEGYYDIIGRFRVTGYVGITSNLTLEAVFGQGRVLVNTMPPMGEVFQDTAVTAKETAEKLTGKSLLDYDLIFSIEAPDVVPSVDGPSAGAAMTLMIISLLEDKPLDPEVSLTGTISTNGDIGPIGGAIEKAVAAEEAGMDTFCIPKANEYTEVTRERYYRVGPIRVKMPYTERVTTKSLIEERTDLNVIILDDVLDLVEIATYKEE